MIKGKVDFNRGCLILLIIIVTNLSGHPSPKDCSPSKISTFPWIALSKHAIGIKHLLSKFWNCYSTIGCWASRGQWNVTGNEEVESGEWYHVDPKLSQIGVKLSWKSQASCNSCHASWYQMIHIAVRWLGELQCSRANIVKCLVVDTEGFIGSLNQTVNRESRVVRLDNRVRGFWWRDYRIRCYYTIWILFTKII